MNSHTTFRDGSPRPESGTRNWDEYAEHRGRVLHRECVAKNVYRYVVEKPEGFEFTPGQAVELAIDEPDWRERMRPFTITSLPDNPRLEFIIKSYLHPQGDQGVTEHLGREVEVNDRVIFSDAWGTIKYRGPGVFIAGGAGVTPFISILRQLEQKSELSGCRLFFSNRHSEDVILQGDLFRMLGRSIVCTLTQESHRDYESGRIDREWLRKRVESFNQPFYVCGPPKMVEEMKQTLRELGADPESLVFED